MNNLSENTLLKVQGIFIFCMYLFFDNDCKQQKEHSSCISDKSGLLTLLLKSNIYIICGKESCTILNSLPIFNGNILLMHTTAAFSPEL